MTPFKLVSFGAVCCWAAISPGFLVAREGKAVFRADTRACLGTLTVSAHILRWKSAFSVCGPSSYERFKVKHGPEVDSDRVYRLRHPGPSCFYPFVRLRYSHDLKAKEIAGWELTAFTSSKALQAGVVDPNGIACSLERMDAPDALKLPGE